MIDMAHASLLLVVSPLNNQPASGVDVFNSRTKLRELEVDGCPPCPRCSEAKKGTG